MAIYTLLENDNTVLTIPLSECSENSDVKKGVLTPDDYLEAIDTGDYQLQLLCANCNNAKRMNNGELYRPHKWTRRSSQGEKCTS
mgnify:CR=1 FL=1|tara:strand:+ start:386 stop:640 length:255 start_codon:yes stop_codon:yes gene_type:complete